MLIDLDTFAPDGGRARALDARMHQQLADSLEHILERGSTSSLDLAPVSKLAKELRSGARVSPAAFGWYYELVFAIFGDDQMKARAALDALSKLSATATSLKVAPLDGLQIDGHRDMYLRRMGAETEGWFHPPAASDVASFRERLEKGFALLKKAAPELADEISAIVREIVLASGDPKTEMQFDGGSAYQLWGLLFLNPAFHPTPIAVAEVLAHESGHLLLFGLTVDEPLVLNPDDELFESPLRVDPRPMDGIYHATFVSARMAWTMRRMANESSLESAERAAALSAADRDTRNFNMGYDVIKEHGKLSDTGEALMSAARRYMATIQ